MKREPMIVKLARLAASMGELGMYKEAERIADMVVEMAQQRTSSRGWKDREKRVFPEGFFDEDEDQGGEIYSPPPPLRPVNQDRLTPKRKHRDRDRRNFEIMDRQDREPGKGGKKRRPSDKFQGFPDDF